MLSIYLNKLNNLIPNIIDILIRKGPHKNIYDTKTQVVFHGKCDGRLDIPDVVRCECMVRMKVGVGTVSVMQTVQDTSNLRGCKC